MRGHSSAIGHHHGLSRGRVPSPAEPAHSVENVIPAATPYRHRNAERRPLQVRSLSRFPSPTSANTDDPAASVMRRNLEPLVTRLYRDRGAAF